MNKKLIGGLELLLASAIYGSYGIFYRLISEFGEFSQGWVRGLIMIVIFGTIFIFNKNKWRNYQKKDIKWFLIWVVPSSFQPIMTFLAFNNLPVGLVYFLMYAAIVISSFISGTVFYNEKVDNVKLFGLTLVLSGIVLIYGTDITLLSNINVIFALISGVMIGFWNTLTKKLSDKYSEEQMIFTDNLSVVLMGLLLSLILGESLPTQISLISWVWIFLFSLISLATGILIVRGFNKVEAQVGSLIVPTEIIFGSIFGYLLFDEKLSLNIYIGGILIFIAAILPYLINKTSKKRQL